MTLAAIPYIKQAMPQHPEAASEEAQAQIQAIRQVIESAIADDQPSGAFELARPAARSVAQVGASMIGQRERFSSDYTPRSTADVESNA